MTQNEQWKRGQGGTWTTESSRRSGETVVAEPAWMRILMWTGLPLLGGGAGWLLKSVAGWVVSLPWAPLQGPFELADRIIASFGEPWATLLALAIGAVAGLLLAFMAEQESLTVSVSGERVTTKRGESLQGIERSSVGAVFLDGKQLVVLGHETEELVREASDLDADWLRDAFVANGYPWLAGDPYRDEYRLWVEGMPDLPAGADALLKARARALGRGDEGREDAAVLRAELAKLGIVVREEQRRQYWRRTGEHGSDQNPFKRRA